MNKLIDIIYIGLTAILIVIASWCISSCAYNPQSTRASVATGTKLGLEYGVKSSTQRTKIANYLNSGAAALYSMVGTPDPIQVAQILNQWLPPDVQTETPEIMTFLVPLVNSTFQSIETKYHVNSLPDIAYGIQVGSSAYISRH